ncbi:Fcf1-domain-containing protein [Kockovaella imperatae]|uniref:U three protein 23 n=1 Tax=Kockovaella imperatae TaxID=4999 RepID=A0A1Y1USG1_9TREE|nr:Fcf1-domain-containing protein [Kockovaella imperatae]ORX40892.1 Fcf1-domain-containing protein [Kockovaella imperatae]
MRHKRAKVYKRAMGIYTQAFNFRQPFQILVSQDILLSLNKESDIHKQLFACVQGNVKPMITQCCIDALYKKGRDYQPLVDIAKTFERRKCNHREVIEPDECLKDVIGQTNKHRYVLAAQSVKLRTSLSTIPGLPMIHFNPRGVLVQSPPSRATLKYKDAMEEERRTEGARVLDGIVDGDNVLGAAQIDGGQRAVAGPSSSGQPRRNRIKGPNPLSVKKKKRKAPDDQAETATKRKSSEPRDVQVEGSDDVRKKKKRKRRGKGEVALAIEEIRAGQMADD